MKNIIIGFIIVFIYSKALVVNAQSNFNNIKANIPKHISTPSSKNSVFLNSNPAFSNLVKPP